jgi:predicted adenylyl cyclase CyaB
LEIEVKVQVADHAAVRDRLRDLGAAHDGLVRETNLFFDRPDGSLRKSDRGLRVRLSRPPGAPAADARALITSKGPAAATGLRSREAFDVHATPADQVIPLLLALGFVQILSFEKDRDSWRLDDCLVELDTLPVFGHFVEVEGPSEGTVLAVQQKIGLGTLPPHHTSYSRMVADYLRTRGEKELRFPSPAGAP